MVYARPYPPAPPPRCALNESPLSPYFPNSIKFIPKKVDNCAECYKVFLQMRDIPEFKIPEMTPALLDMERARAELHNAISWMNCEGYEQALERICLAVELFEKHGMKKE